MNTFTFSHPDGSVRQIRINKEQLSVSRVLYFTDLAAEAFDDDRALIASLAKIYRAAGSDEHMILSDIESDLEENEWYPGTKAEAIDFMADYLSRCESLGIWEIDPWWEYIRHVQAAAGTSLPREYFFCSCNDGEASPPEDIAPVSSSRVDWVNTADENGAFDDDEVDMSDIIFDPGSESRVAFLKRWHRIRLERLREVEETDSD